MARVMEIVTPLGEDVLLFHSLHAREELSRLSEYQIDLLSKQGNIDLDKILGELVTVKLALDGEDDQTRFFNGYVTRFTQSGMLGTYHRYLAVVRPWLWFLSRTADCRIFQERSVPDILKAVFADHPMADVSFALSSKYRKWTYCVQYRETDFNFISRLMEHEGMYYYFRHTNGHDTLVVTDSVSGHSAAPGAEEIPFIGPDAFVKPTIERVSSWELSREIQPGAFVHSDYDFSRPSVSLRTQKAVPHPKPRSDYDVYKYEVYDYPGGYVQEKIGQEYASVRIDEFAAQFEAAHGVTNVKALGVGALFTLDRCPRADQNREHLVVAASTDFEFSGYEGMPNAAGPSYRSSFAAMPSQQQFRPRRTTPKPFVQGPQTAMIVGPGGDEIHTDKYGRVKVQFHWDRLGERNENSSCWVRVSSPWAGKGWGAVSTPRIGQEVIVDFLEGDPDQPIVTGRVYNEEQQPPFGFPAGAVVSGIKSNTHKGRGYNELSMDDTAGKEKVTIHAQFDMGTVVEHDQTTTVHRHRTDNVDVDDSETVGKNQTCRVGVDQTLNVGSNQSATIGANRSMVVGANETATVALQRTHSVGGNETISVGAAQEVTVGGLQAVTVGANQTVHVGADQSTSVGSKRSVTVGSDETHSVAGERTTDIGKDEAVTIGKNWVVDAGDSVTIKTGDASITMKKDGTITIKGKDINITGSGKVNVKASSDVVVKGSKVGIN